MEGGRGLRGMKGKAPRQDNKDGGAAFCGLNINGRGVRMSASFEGLGSSVACVAPPAMVGF